MLSSANPYFFVSYLHSDQNSQNSVLRIIEDLYAQNIPIWVDYKQIHPGDNWQDALEAGLSEAAGLILFVSRKSLESSDIRRELTHMLRSEKAILPVLIDRYAEIPPELAHVQWIDFTGDYSFALKRLVDAARHILAQADTTSQALETQQIEFFATQQAESLAETTESFPNSIFVMHGHDQDFLDEVSDYLESIGVQAIVIREQENKPETLFQKFFRLANQAKVALVLVTPDDFGASLREYNGESAFSRQRAGESSLKFRARQNVILELGFFYGRLGTDRVMVLYKPSDFPNPNFERPSDLDGVLWDDYDKLGRWKNTLKKKLIEVGLQL